MSEVDDLSMRVNKLESGIRKTRLAGGIGVILVAVFALAIGLRTKKTIEANEILLKDRFGNTIATLGGEYGGCLSLRASTKTASVDLCASSWGASLNLKDQEHKSSAELSAGLLEREAGWRYPSLYIQYAGKTGEVSVGDDDAELLMEDRTG